MRRISLLVVIFSLLGGVQTVAAQDASAASCKPPLIPVEVETGIGADGVEGGQSVQCVPDPNRPPKRPDRSDPPSHPVTAPDPYEYAYAYDCPGRSVSTLATGQVGGDACESAALACEFEGAEGAQRLQIFRRPRGSDAAWQQIGTTCGPGDAPPGAPAPPIPTQAQIQQAFKRLPFAKPSVNIQPEGDVTLVNLPTYFEAKWPAEKLGPGDISAPVQLLSWSIEFRIDPATYNYDFGDGTFSGATEDLGGPYPEGLIRHTYTQPNPTVPVKVDAELTGSYRVNGGANWIPLNGVADLQDEPVVTLEVREAKARLYNNG